MNRIKRFFVMPWLVLLALASLHTLWRLVWGPERSLAWWGAALALWPALGFMIHLGRGHVARTTALLPVPLFAATAGGILALMAPQLWPTLYAWGPGVAGVYGYVFWYSSLERVPNPRLQPGERLPDIHLMRPDGTPVSIEALRGHYALLLFVRGNWCPLCVAQVTELAAAYRELAARDVRVWVISPQPHERTRALAARFDVPLEFYVDNENRAARALGIAHLHGVPAGLPGGYDEDTVMPTAILLDPEGMIVFADLTDNYRVRPEPETFIRIIDRQTREAADD